MLLAVAHRKNIKPVFYGIWLHPKKANKLGIKSGDTVRLRNPLNGRIIEGTAFVTDWVREDTVFIHNCFGAKKLPGQAFGEDTEKMGLAQFLDSKNAYEHFAGGYVSQDFIVRIEKA